MTRLARASTILTAIGVLHAAVAAQGLPSFHPQDQFKTGSLPESVAIADLDSNGALDLVTANANANTVSVLLSTVPGSFKTKASFGVGPGPDTVAIGDLNEDGYLDLVTGNFLSNDVSVLLGTGTGSFAAQSTFGVGSQPSSIALGELNGDGHLDLVTAGGGTVSVLLGTGAGSFGAATNYSTWQASSLAIGDLNGDGTLDLVTVGGSTVSVLLGTGAGSFGAATDYTASAGSSLAIGDLNSDGTLDLVTAGGSTVSVLLGTGAGSFGAQTNFPVPANAYLRSVAIGDLNADGLPDLAAAGEVSTVFVLPGMGAGSFGAPATFGVSGVPLSIAIKDVNGDLKLDIVTANGDSNSVSVLLNAGSPTTDVPWTYLGHGKTGTGNEMPWLLGNGPLTAGSVNFLSLDNAKPNSYSFFCYGSALDYTPFKGGTMVPASPQYFIVPIASNGSFSIQFQYPAGLSGVTVCLQNWVKDAGATSGYSASNALQVVGQP